MDNSLKPIEDYITSGLAERFFKVFGVPLLFYQGPDVKTVAAKMLKDRNLPSYPYARAKVSTAAVGQDTYKPNTLLRRGLKSRASNDNVLTYELNMAPIDQTYDLTFYVQDYPTLRKFIKQWLFVGLRGNFKFSITYGVADVDIDVDMEKQVNVPERPGGSTDVKEYELNTQFTVHGYFSDDIHKVQAAITVEQQIEILEEMAAKGGRVEIFNKEWATCGTCTSGEVPTDPGGGTGGEGDKTFVYTRPNASTLWTINHNLNKYPSVTIVDNSGSLVEAEAHFPSLNTVLVTFGIPMAGTAFMN